MQVMPLPLADGNAITRACVHNTTFVSPGLSRAAVLARCAGLIRDRAEDGAVILVRENGKTLAEARVEVAKTADFLDYYASFARQPWGELLADARPGTQTSARVEPVGVVLAICPWNDPLITPARKLGPALIAVAVSRGAEVCTFDLRRERRRACVPVAAPEGFDPASIPLVAGGLLVLAACDGTVSAIDVATMKVRWSKRDPNPILAVRPESVGGVVMFSDWSRRAWARRLADGSEVGIPAGDGWAVATVADPGGGFDVAKRDMDGGWIEHWVPVV